MQNSDFDRRPETNPDPYPDPYPDPDPDPDRLCWCAANLHSEIHGCRPTDLHRGSDCHQIGDLRGGVRTAADPHCLALSGHRGRGRRNDVQSEGSWGV